MVKEYIDKDNYELFRIFYIKFVARIVKKIVKPYRVSDLYFFLRYTQAKLTFLARVCPVSRAESR